MLPSCTYNTPKRLSELASNRGDAQTFAKQSENFAIPIGTGAVGRVYASKEPEFLPDAAEGADLPPSETRQCFLRASLAKEFGIKSIACVSFEGGVLEYGTTQEWSNVPTFETDGLLANKLGSPLDDIEIKAKAQNENPALKWKLTYWDAENEAFWNTWGKSIAWRNLLISIPNLCLAFATWIMWSILVTQVQDAHDADSTAFQFSDWPDMDKKKNYKAQLSMLPSIAGLAGATLRVVNTFMVAVNGGQCSNAMNSTLTILPMVAIGIAFASGDVPFWVLCVLAACSGFGGGAFASSMSGISFFFPKSQQGMALGLNAGIGNLGVSLTQLLIPRMCGFAAFGGDAIGGKYPMNAGWFYVILLILAATPAWLFANYMPKHGSPTGSMVENVLGYLRLEGLGYIGIVVGVALFLVVNPLVKGSPPLIIGRIFILAILACLCTLMALWFLSSAPIKAKLRTQSAIFYDKHTWAMTWLYIMTFGSFIGYSSAFPKIIKDVFGYLPNGDKNPNAPDVASYAWMGACIGSLARPIGGWLSDKLGPQGGAIVTHWGTIVEIAATVLVGIFVRLAVDSDTPEKYFLPFLICFLFLFGATGSSNGSTFRQISVMFPPEKAGPVLGWTSAVAAYGAAIFPACFGAGIKGDFVDIVLYVFAAYYTSCLFVNYWFYYRTNAEKPC
jgi:NNP family nitrate/nitrite transporter-like MFS transporter